MNGFIKRLDADFEEPEGLTHLTTLMFIAKLPAFVNGVTVRGMLQIRHIGQVTASVRQLFVCPSDRFTGVASKLMDEAEEIATASKCRGVNLTINPKLEHLIGMYRRRGYLEAYAEENGGWVMIKPLNER